MHLSPQDGTLTLRTGVTGSAARMGHNLVLAIDQWSAVVDRQGPDPIGVTLRADLRSMRVESGSGGVKPLSEGDRRTIRDNALRSLGADRHPEVTFVSESVTRVNGGLDVAGTVSIHGHSEPLEASVDLLESTDRISARCTVAVRQSSFGVQPYSAMLGQLKVADEVQVDLSITLALT